MKRTTKVLTCFGLTVLAGLTISFVSRDLRPQQGMRSSVINGVPATSPNLLISVAPAVVTMAQGAAATTTVAVTPLSGFRGWVALTDALAPAGVRLRFSPARVAITRSGPVTSIVNVTTSASARPGYYPINILGNSAQVSSYESLNLEVMAAANALPFTLSLPRTDSFTMAGTTKATSVTLATTDDYSNIIRLSLADDPLYPILGAAGGADPARMYATFSSSSLAGNGASILTFSVGASVAPGLYHFLVTGTSSDGSVQVTPYSLMVTPVLGGPTMDEAPAGTVTYTGDAPPFPLAAKQSEMVMYYLAPPDWRPQPVPPVRKALSSLKR